MLSVAPLLPHRYRNKLVQILCDACTDQFNSWHTIQTEWLIDTHGSMETEQRIIWFDLRLIICQRGDGTLSVSVSPWIACHTSVPKRHSKLWNSDHRSNLTQHVVFKFWQMINGFPPSFCSVLGRLKWDQVGRLGKGINQNSAQRLCLILLFYLTWHYSLKSCLLHVLKL